MVAIKELIQRQNTMVTRQRSSYQRIKRILWGLALMCGATGNAFAQFDATVDKSALALGRTLKLELTLSDAKAKGDPDVSGLEANFTILSKGTSSSYQFINGEASRTFSWTYYLSPRSAGTATIPPISLKTNKGVQTSNKIDIVVSTSAPATGNTPHTGTTHTPDIWLEASVSEREPYVQQSIIYTLKVLRMVNVQNAELVVPELNNAVFEQIGESTSTTSIRNGRRVNETVIQYAFTPLIAGKFTIPALQLKTQIQAPGNRGLFGGFLSYEPALISGQPVELSVRPASVSNTAWLPLHNLHLEEQWPNESNAKEGEPLTRVITMVATGTSGDQLPALSTDFGNQFKVYAERPETSQQLDHSGRHLIGRRQQTLTMIPLRAGDIVVPEIRVPWFNVNTGEEEVAIMPARRLTVAPAHSSQLVIAQPAAPATSGQTDAPQASNQAPSLASPIVPMTDAASPWMYFIAGAVSSTIVLIAVWLWHKRRTNRLESNQRQNVASKTSHPTYRALRKQLTRITTEDELREALARFAAERWCLSVNTTLASIAAHFGNENPTQHDTIERLFHQLDAHRYADQALDIRHWCEQMQAALAHFSENGIPTIRPVENENSLPQLNPQH